MPGRGQDSLFLPRYRWAAAHLAVVAAAAPAADRIFTSKKARLKNSFPLYNQWKRVFLYFFKPHQGVTNEYCPYY